MKLTVSKHAPAYIVYEIYISDAKLMNSFNSNSLQIINTNKLLREDVTGSKNIFSWFNMNFLNIFPSQSICMLNRKNNMKNSFVSFICRLSISLTTSVDHKRLSTAQNTCEKILFLSEAVEAVFYTPQQWDHLCRHSKRNENPLLVAIFKTFHQEIIFESLRWSKPLSVSGISLLVCSKLKRQTLRLSFMRVFIKCVCGFESLIAINFS